MAKVYLLVLKLLIILVFAGWASLWLLKPTELWTRKWHRAEESASHTVFGYNGLHYAVYTFPIIACAIIGFVYLELKRKESSRRQGRSSVSVLSNPVVVNGYIGIWSAFEILGVFLFIFFLAWTFYARVSNDFNKTIPIKSFKLEKWQYKMFRMATRCGLLAEACLALLLLPILRGLAVFRLLGIQFEASVRYHTWLGTAMIFFAALHGSGTLFIWGIKRRILDEIWKWQKEGRIYLAGEITLVIGLTIWITSLPQIRRKQFEIFYYTHHLYILFLLFFLFHGGDRHFYMVFPGIYLFVLDKLLRIIQSRPNTCILSVRIFPCQVIELTFPKDPRLNYTPGSIVFIKIPRISKFQWHSFSITSSSGVDDDTMSIMIKGEGWWTNSLYTMLQSETNSDADRRKCIPVAIEGPYGPATTNFLRYDSLLLISGGIGITPFLSILQEIGCTQSTGRYRFPSQIQLIYAVKKSNDISLLTPIFPLLQGQEIKQLQLKLKLFVTQEQQSGSTIKELLNEYSQIQDINFVVKDSIYSTYGDQSLPCLAAIVGISSILFLICLSFFNHIFISPAKKGPSKRHKFSSSVTDVLLVCSFAIAITCSVSMVMILRWRNLRKGLPPFSENQDKIIKERSSVEIDRSLEQHEIHFGRRPNFQDIFSKFPDETDGLDIGVLVCGPESMKSSVASICQLNSQGFSRIATQKRRPYFSFHSLNFTL